MKLQPNTGEEKLYYMLEPRSFVPRKRDELVKFIAERAGQLLWNSLYRDGSFQSIHDYLNSYSHQTVPEIWWSMLRSRRAMSSRPKMRSVYDVSYGANCFLSRISGPTNAFLKSAPSPILVGNDAFAYSPMAFSAAKKFIDTHSYCSTVRRSCGACSESDAR